MVVWWCRFREKGPMQEAREEFKDLIDRFIALQFLFDKQWKVVKVDSRALEPFANVEADNDCLLAEGWAYLLCDVWSLQ